MEDWQMRVIEERDQLKERFEKLDRFINADALFSALPFPSRTLLIRQRYHMSCYLEVLTTRVDSW